MYNCIYSPNNLRSDFMSRGLDFISAELNRTTKLGQEIKAVGGGDECPNLVNPAY